MDLCYLKEELEQEERTKSRHHRKNWADLGKSLQAAEDSRQGEFKLAELDKRRVAEEKRHLANEERRLAEEAQTRSHELAKELNAVGEKLLSEVHRECELTCASFNAAITAADLRINFYDERNSPTGLARFSLRQDQTSRRVTFFIHWQNRLAHIAYSIPEIGGGIGNIIGCYLIEEGGQLMSPVSLETHTPAEIAEIVLAEVFTTSAASTATESTSDKSTPSPKERRSGLIDSALRFNRALDDRSEAEAKARAASASRSAFFERHSVRILNDLAQTMDSLASEFNSVCRDEDKHIKVLQESTEAILIAFNKHPSDTSVGRSCSLSLRESNLCITLDIKADTECFERSFKVVPGDDDEIRVGVPVVSESRSVIWPEDEGRKPTGDIHEDLRIDVKRTKSTKYVNLDELADFILMSFVSQAW
jgi:hypothetical protein